MTTETALPFTMDPAHAEWLSAAAQRLAHEFTKLVEAKRVDEEDPRSKVHIVPLTELTKDIATAMATSHLLGAQTHIWDPQTKVTRRYDAVTSVASEPVPHMLGETLWEHRVPGTSVVAVVVRREDGRLHAALQISYATQPRALAS